MKNSTLITLLCFLCTMVCYKTNAQDAVATEDPEWSPHRFRLLALVYLLT